MAERDHLKLVSYNIEGHKHIKHIAPLLRRHNPDVVCLQEVFEQDFERLKRELKMNGRFAVMTYREDVRGFDQVKQGLAMLSKFPLARVHMDFYYGHPRRPPTYIHPRTETVNRLLLTARIRKNGKKYVVGNTHFTWTPDGHASKRQIEDLSKMFRILGKFPEIAFCGDFNAPRGRSIFERIAKRYKDNIPKRYKTSLNAENHYAGKLILMVDGLFSTPGYSVRNVKLLDGPSDHRAVYAEICVREKLEAVLSPRASARARS